MLLMVRNLEVKVYLATMWSLLRGIFLKSKSFNGFSLLEDKSLQSLKFYNLRVLPWSGPVISPFQSASLCPCFHPISDLSNCSLFSLLSPFCPASAFWYFFPCRKAALTLWNLLRGLSRVLPERPAILPLLHSPLPIHLSVFSTDQHVSWGLFYITSPVPEN